MQYLMVTSFDYHWDKITDNRTYYTLRMIKWDIEKKPPLEGADTIFIKIDSETKKFERCWKGKVSRLDRVEADKTRIYFDVQIEKTIECPPQFINRHEGWYDISLLRFPIKDQNERILTSEDIKKLTIPQLIRTLSIGTWALLVFIIISSVGIGFQVGYGVKTGWIAKKDEYVIKSDVVLEINSITEMHSENMRKLYESIIEEEHRAGLAKDAFEEGRHTDSISRLKILLEREKRDFEEKIKDIIKSKK